MLYSILIYSVSSQHYEEPEVLSRQLCPGRLLRTIQVFLQPLFLARRLEPVHPGLEDR